MIRFFAIVTVTGFYILMASLAFEYAPFDPSSFIDWGFGTALAGGYLMTVSMIWSCQ